LGKRLANKLGKPLRLVEGAGQNPSHLPRVGEVWRGLRGDRCRIVKVDGNQGTVLQLDTGHRVTRHLHDFLATYKPPARINPKRHTRRARRNPELTRAQSGAVSRLRRYAEEYGLEVVTAGQLTHGAVHVDYRDPKKRRALRAIILPSGAVQGDSRLVEAN